MSRNMVNAGVLAIRGHHFGMCQTMERGGTEESHCRPAVPCAASLPQPGRDLLLVLELVADDSAGTGVARAGECGHGSGGARALLITLHKKP